jgi:hypothetical protein
MAGKPLIFRPQGTDTEYAARTRDVVRRSREALEQAVPDTFLGRKTQEPFPAEKEKERGRRIGRRLP